MCEQPAHGCYAKAKHPGLELTVTTPDHALFSAIHICVTLLYHYFVADLSQSRVAAAGGGVAMTTSTESSRDPSVISTLYEHRVCQWPVCDTHCADVATFYK